MIAVIYGLWTPGVTLNFPYVVFDHLSHLGPSHVVDPTGKGGEAIETMLQFLQAAVPVDAAILLSGTHRIYYHWRKALEAAGIPMLHSERSGLPHLLTLDPSGLNGVSEISNHPLGHHDLDDALVDTYASLIAREIPANPDEAETFAFIERNRAEGRKVVVYFGVWDEASGIQDPDPLYAMATGPRHNSSQEALDEVRASLERMSEKVALLIKPHPSDGYVVPLEGLSSAVPQLFVPPTVDAVGLVPRCDVAVTIASTLSYVAVAAKKPLVLMGRNLLSNKHVAYEVTAAEEMDTALSDAVNLRGWEERLENRKHFLWEFARLYPNYTSRPELQALGMKPIEDVVPVLETLADRRGSTADAAQPTDRSDVWYKMMQLILALGAAKTSGDTPDQPAAV